MLHNAKKLEGMNIVAIDGKVGKVEDLYFDEEKWVIRHLEADTGGWLTGRRVLLSPISVIGIDWRDDVLRVNLAQEQIQNSPGLDTHKPISRQHEADIYRHYGYPAYWSGPYLWGYTIFPTLMEKAPMEDPARRETRERMEEQGRDPHLRACKEVTGYHIHARDDTLGHVEDFLFDEKDWSVRLLVIDTRNWWPGKHVLIPPQRVERISWEHKEVFINATRVELESSPEYDSKMSPLTGEYGLYRFSDRTPDNKN